MADEVRYDGKVAVVTGAGRGLGRHYALELSLRGASVLVNDAGVELDASGGDARVANLVAQEIGAAGGEALASTTNLREPGGATEVVKAAMDRWGRVDIVVNNAGVAGPDKDLAECSDAEIDAVIDTNLRGAYRVSSAAWPIMVAQHFGRIVNVTSHSVFGAVHTAAYIIARSGSLGLTAALAAEGERHNIKVNAIMPAAYTRMTAEIPNEGFRALVEQLLPAHTVAPVVLMLAAEQAPCSGQTFTVGGGFVARVALGVGAGEAGISTPEQALNAFTRIADLSEATFPQSIPDVMAHHIGGVMKSAGSDSGLDLFN